MRLSIQRPSILEIVEFLIVPVAYSAATLTPEDRVAHWVWPALTGLVFLTIGVALGLAHRRPLAELLTALFFLVLTLLVLIDIRLVWLMIPLVSAVVMAFLAYLAIKRRA